MNNTRRMGSVLLWAALLVGVAPVRALTLQQRETPPAGRDAYRPAVPGVNGLVTAGHPLASMAGIRILMSGGNAADASVAVLSTLNVVRPQMSGAGGNGFATIYDQKTNRIYALAATGAAARALDPQKVTAEQRLRGIHAGVVPGLLGGWIALLERFGTLSLKEVLQPAIEYAENGHPIEASVARSIESGRATFEQFPTSARVFLPNGRVPKPGEVFRMPDLANTYKKVVEAEQAALRQGKSRSDALWAAFDRFYKGDIAQEMARFYQENGGEFTLEDFAAYRPIWREPVRTTYRGYELFSSPPTSRTGLEVMMQLNLVEAFEVQKLGHNSAEGLHLIAEAIKVTKSDVYRYVADPKFVDVPVAELLSKEYAGIRRPLIAMDQASAFPAPGDPRRLLKTEAGGSSLQLPSPDSPEKSEDGSTDSFSIADRFGNVVACTPTHGGIFGTYVVVGNTGLTFNNGTRDGSVSPYVGHVNYVRGGQIPILGNGPIIVLKDGRFFLSLGTPGGETIGQTQFQVLLNLLDHGMGIQEAIEAPRIVLNADPNFYKPGAAITLRIENRLSPEVLRGLERLGHRIELTAGYSGGVMQGILVDLATGTMHAGADPRGVAYAIGY